MGLPPTVAQMVTRRTLGALRGYFAGVTAIAAFNAIVIGLGALCSASRTWARSCSSTSSPRTSPTWAPGRPARSRC